MIKGILTYLAVFLMTLYWFFMFNESVAAFMIVLEAIYLVYAIIFCMIAKGKISASMDKVILTAEKNQNVPIRVLVKNTSKLFNYHFRLYLKIENTLTGEKTRFKTMATVERSGNRTLTIPISAGNCGTMQITLQKIKVFDLLMFMGSVKRVRDSIQVRILPELHLLPVEVTRNTREFIADADEYSDKESGDDSSEIYQIREYTDQDSIHDIHWKLSAKSDQLLVKEYGKALGSSVLIWINTSDAHKNLIKKTGRHSRRIGKRKRGTGTILPEVLEIVASISLSLFEGECVHTVAWYEPDNGFVRKKRVSKEIHIYELLNRLALIQPYADEEELKVIYKDSFRGENFSTIIEVKSGGAVFVNDESIEIALKKGDIEWEQIAFTV